MFVYPFLTTLNSVEPRPILHRGGRFDRRFCFPDEPSSS